MTEEAVQIAVLKLEVDYLKGTIDEMRGDLKEIKTTLTEARGGWKTLMLVAGISSTMGALFIKVMPWLTVAPK
jgi:hypothetical protein